MPCPAPVIIPRRLVRSRAVRFVAVRSGVVDCIGARFFPLISAGWKRPKVPGRRHGRLLRTTGHNDRNSAAVPQPAYVAGAAARRNPRSPHERDRATRISSPSPDGRSISPFLVITCACSSSSLLSSGLREVLKCDSIPVRLSAHAGRPYSSNTAAPVPQLPPTITGGLPARLGPHQA